MLFMCKNSNLVGFSSYSIFQQSILANLGQENRGTGVCILAGHSILALV